MDKEEEKTLYVGGKCRREDEGAAEGKANADSWERAVLGDAGELSGAGHRASECPPRFQCLT